MRADPWLQRHPAVCVALQALCFWPVWQWYAARLVDGSDEPWGIVALLAALALTWPRDRRPQLDPADRLLKWSAALTLGYALLTPIAPPLIRALLAVAAIACSWSSVTGSRTKLPVITALLALSLPVIASMQFYLGYPLRAITASGASVLLAIEGYEIERVGTAMQWQGHTVLVDAPCSGVRMLWAGAFLACILAARRDVARWAGLCGTLLLVIPVVLVANVIRAAVLFILEVRPQPESDLVHSLVGAAAFAITGIGMVAVDSIMRGRERLV